MARRSFGMPLLDEYRWFRGFSTASASFFDRDVGRREVGVAEPEVDHVLAGAPGVDLEGIHDPEDVRRQRVDPAEFHHVDGTSRLPRPR